MKVAIVGSRDIDDYEYLCEVWDRLPEKEVTHIVTGDANGVDALARKLAKGYKKLIVHKADWKTHGNAAGPIRNQKIIDDADMLMAIWDGTSKGTKDSILKAVEKGIPMIVKVVERKL